MNTPDPDQGRGSLDEPGRIRMDLRRILKTIYNLYYLQAAGAGKSFVTHGTLVWLNARMRAHMAGQMAGTGESSIADRTNVRLLAGVRSLMDHGRFLACKHFVAHVARIRSFSGVRPLVDG